MESFFFIFSQRGKEKQAVSLQRFGIAEYACNFYNSAQTSLPHLVDITGRGIWENKPRGGMWDIPQNEFLIGCCLKHFESPSFWKGGLSDFVDLVFSLVGRYRVFLVCLVGGFQDSFLWMCLPLSGHAMSSRDRNGPTGKPESNLWQTVLDRGGPFDSKPLGTARSLQKVENFGERCYLREGFGKDPAF